MAICVCEYPVQEASSVAVAPFVKWYVDTNEEPGASGYPFLVAEECVWHQVSYRLVGQVVARSHLVMRGHVVMPDLVMRIVVMSVVMQARHAGASSRGDSTTPPPSHPRSPLPFAFRTGHIDDSGRVRCAEYD